MQDKIYKGVISYPYSDVVVFDIDYIFEVMTEKTHDICTGEREFGLRLVLR